MLIHRILSAIFLVCIVWPLFILYCVIAFLFTIVNNLTYHNFWEKVIVPDETWVKIPRNAFTEVYTRLLVILVSSFFSFIENLKGIKTSRF